VARLSDRARPVEGTASSPTMRSNEVMSDP
jgi:hypothetical protein